MRLTSDTDRREEDSSSRSLYQIQEKEVFYMKSERIMPKVGSLYKLRDHEGYVLEVLRTLPEDGYSPFSARVRSIITGWTMTIHGINQYEDGSIDWDFSTDGIFTRVDENGVYHQI